MRSAQLPWKQAFAALEKDINAEGIYTHPFDPAFPVDVAFFIHAGRDNVRMNRHSSLEVMYVYAGSTEVQVADRSHLARVGDLLVIGANLYHRVVNRSYDEVKLISLNFDPSVIHTVGAQSDEEQYLTPFFCETDEFPRVISRSDMISQRVRELILEIHNELPANSSLSRLAVKTYMRMLLLLLRQHYEHYLQTRTLLDSKQQNIQRFAPLFAFLEEHYDRSIHVAEAARLCAMSSSHFMSFFKRTTGESFVAYLNRFRVAKAQLLLSTTNEPIAEVSARLSFCSQSYFGKVFHEFVGMTPHTYRERFGNNSLTDQLAPRPALEFAMRQRLRHSQREPNERKRANVAASQPVWNRSDLGIAREM